MVFHSTCMIFSFSETDTNNSGSRGKNVVFRPYLSPRAKGKNERFLYFIRKQGGTQIFSLLIMFTLYIWQHIHEKNDKLFLINELLPFVTKNENSTYYRKSHVLLLVVLHFGCTIKFSTFFLYLQSFRNVSHKKVIQFWNFCFYKRVFS